MKKAVICIVQTRQQADDVVGRLQAAGFRNNDISVLFPDPQGSRDFAAANATKAPEGAVAGAGAGGVVGGAVGLLAGIGALVIPGLGPFIAAGPLLATLGGVAAGVTVGGITGALVGMGIPEDEAKRYEGKVRGGGLLVSVHTETPEEAQRARQIFATVRADDISTTQVAPTPTRHIS